MVIRLLAVSSYTLVVLAFALPFWSTFTVSGNKEIHGFQGLFIRCYQQDNATCCGVDGSSYRGKAYSFSQWMTAVKVFLGVFLLNGIPLIVITIFATEYYRGVVIVNAVNALLLLISLITFATGIKAENWISTGDYNLCFYLICISTFLHCFYGLLYFRKYRNQTRFTRLENYGICECCSTCKLKCNQTKAWFSILIHCYVLQISAFLLPTWSAKYNADGQYYGYEGIIGRCYFDNSLTCCGVIKVGETSNTTDAFFQAEFGLSAVWFGESLASITGLTALFFIYNHNFTSRFHSLRICCVLLCIITALCLLACVIIYTTLGKTNYSFSYYVTILVVILYGCEAAFPLSRYGYIETDDSERERLLHNERS